MAKIYIYLKIYHASYICTCSITYLDPLHPSRALQTAEIQLVYQTLGSIPKLNQGQGVQHLLEDLCCRLAAASRHRQTIDVRPHLWIAGTRNWKIPDW